MKRIFSINTAAQRKSLEAQFKKQIIKPLAIATVGGDGSNFAPKAGQGVVASATKLANTAVKESKRSLSGTRKKLNDKLPKALKAKVKQFNEKMQAKVLGDVRASAQKEIQKLLKDWQYLIEKEMEGHDFSRGGDFSVLFPGQAGENTKAGQARGEARRKAKHMEVRLAEEAAKFAVAYVNEQISKMKEWAGISEWHLIQKEWEYINRICAQAEKTPRVSRYTKSGVMGIRYGFTHKHAAAFEQMVPMIGLGSLPFDARDAFPKLRGGNVSFSSPDSHRKLPKDIIVGQHFGARRKTIQEDRPVPVPLGYEDVKGGPKTFEDMSEIERDKIPAAHRRRVADAMRRGQFPKYTQGTRGGHEKVLPQPGFQGGKLEQKTDFMTVGDYTPMFITPGQRRDMETVMANKLKETKGKHNIYYFFKIWPQYRPGLAPYFFKPGGTHFPGAGDRSWANTVLQSIGTQWRKDMKAALKGGRGQSAEQEEKGQGGGSDAPKNLGVFTEETGGLLQQLLKALEEGLREGHRRAYNERKAKQKKPSKMPKSTKTILPAKPLGPSRFAPQYTPGQQQQRPQETTRTWPRRRKGDVSRRERKILDRRKGKRTRRRRRPKG